MVASRLVAAPDSLEPVEARANQRQVADNWVALPELLDERSGRSDCLRGQVSTCGNVVRRMRAERVARHSHQVVLTA
jgi:hypothetical protein